MKKTYIENTKALDLVIDGVEGKAKARTLTHTKIADILVSVEKKLALPKVALKGVRVTFTGAEKFPTAYKYTPESTHFTAEFTGKKWKVCSITRDTCPNSHKAVSIDLTDTAEKYLLERFRTL